MNYAMIFAGGMGKRMNTRSTPKQFLEINGKPILAHTLEVFEEHPQIDAIVIACHEDWLEYCRAMLAKYHFTKARHVVAGGRTGQESIYNALSVVKDAAPDSIVLIHDGVRPLIDAEVISQNIASVKKFGSAITCVPASETVVHCGKKRHITAVIERSVTWIAKAPQSFFLHDILRAHEQAIRDGLDNVIDSCTLMAHYGHRLAVVKGTYSNIKVTTPEDFYILRALLQARENAQIIGL
jgi:2-C-methyl-D-erythritol 4-phosphate cytidylyltransferase